MTDARPLWCPPGANPVNHYGMILGKLWGGLLPPPTDKPCILAIRGVALFAEETHEVVAKPAYDDCGALFVPGSEPFLFPLSTHSYQVDSKLSPDVDGDGRGDVATIRTGLYVLTLAVTNPHPIWIMTTLGGSGKIRCMRDTSHDGRFQKDEQDREDYATAVLLHTGHDAPAGAAHRSSIACQVASLRTLEVIARAGKTILYRLVDADVAIEAAKLVTPDTLPPENQA